MFFDLILDEPDDLSLLSRIEDIHFGEQYRNIRCESAEIPHELNVMLGERNVGTHGDKRQTDVGQPLDRCGGVVFENTLESGRIDEPDTVFHRGHLNPHDRHAFPIRWVLFFGDKLVHMLYGNHMCAAVEKTDFGALFRPVLNLNDDSRHGNNADGQHRTSEELIQKTALTGLEPAEDRDIQNFFFSE